MESISPGQDSEPIYHTSRKCLVLFDECITNKVLSAESLTLVGELRGQFKIWAAYIGAFAVSRASLDARLTSHDDIRNMVLDLLTILERNLRWAKEYQLERGEEEDTEEFEASLGTSAVKSTIERLFILAVAIRRSARQTHDRQKTSGYGHKDPSCFLLLKNRYPNARKSLLDQLVQSVHARGVYLQYLQSHNQKLAHERETTNTAREEPVEEKSRQLEDHPVPVELLVRKSETELETIPSILSPTTVIRQHMRRIKQSPSLISTGSTVEDPRGDDLPYPPMLKGDSQTGRVACTICSKPVVILALTEKKWKSHVDGDLHPYVCISEQCKEPSKFFKGRRDWAEHMQTRHTMEWVQIIHTETWQCDIEHSGSKSFDQQDHFVSHLKDYHHKQFTSYQIQGRARRSKKTVTRDPFVCPLCDRVPDDLKPNVHDKPYDKLTRHIGHHLKYISFLSLSYLDVNFGDGESIAGLSSDGNEKTVSRTSRSPNKLRDVSLSDIPETEILEDHSCKVHDQVFFDDPPPLDEHLDWNFMPRVSRETNWDMLRKGLRATVDVFEGTVNMSAGFGDHFPGSTFSGSASVSTDKHSRIGGDHLEVADEQSLLMQNRFYDYRIQICYDRGNTYFEQDQRQARRPYPAGVSPPPEEGKKLISCIKNEFWGSVLTPPGESESRFFLPRTKLLEILTPERVLIIIGNLPGRGQLWKESPQTFADAIFHGDTSIKKSLKLLAALLCSDLEEKFCSLVEEGVSDMCLPPIKERKGNVSSMVCQNCSAKHAYLADSQSKSFSEFYAWAYALNAPYFKRLGQEHQKHRPHAHYVLRNEDVLPIVGDDHSDNKTSRPSNRTTTKPHRSHEGGFSTITPVIFHDDHFDLGSQKGVKYKKFAMKQLTTSNEEEFKKEVASLLMLEGDDNQNLVKLLATFEIHSNSQIQYYLIFPWADGGTLWNFWESHDAPDGRVMHHQWMADQCYRLALALQSFHNERSDQLRRMYSGREDDGQLVGRHGDINAENILWFERQNELLLNGFGLAHLHTKVSRSAQDPKDMARTETYRAPEFDVTDGKISRNSDIFSLGCVFLEFVTWALKGHHSAGEEFTNRRLKRDPAVDFETDTFFEVEHKNGNKVAVIKSTVKTWIEELKENPTCSNYINDFLDLIELHMLEPEPKKRWSCFKVVRTLELFSNTCRADTSYWKDPKDSHTLPVIGGSCSDGG